MNCDAVVGRIDALLAGTLALPEHEQALTHLRGCADCRGLVAALAAAGPADEDPGLSAAIVARTSGPACARARRQLCARLDGELEGLDLELVERHVDRCVECAGLARALERLAVELPRLATLDPGPWFVQGVLARTSRRPRPARATRIARLLARPRFALEAAFLATMLLAWPALTFGLAPGRDRAPLAGLRGTVGDVERGARQAWTASGAAAAGLARRSAEAVDSIRVGLGTFSASAASGAENKETDR